MSCLVPLKVTGRPCVEERMVAVVVEQRVALEVDRKRTVPTVQQRARVFNAGPESLQRHLAKTGGGDPGWPPADALSHVTLCVDLTLLSPLRRSSLEMFASGPNPTHGS